MDINFDLPKKIKEKVSSIDWENEDIKVLVTDVEVLQDNNPKKWIEINVELKIIEKEEMYSKPQKISLKAISDDGNYTMED